MQRYFNLSLISLFFLKYSKNLEIYFLRNISKRQFLQLFIRQKSKFLIWIKIIISFFVDSCERETTLFWNLTFLLIHLTLSFKKNSFNKCNFLSDKSQSFWIKIIISFFVDKYERETTLFWNLTFLLIHVTLSFK